MFKFFEFDNGWLAARTRIFPPYPFICARLFSTPSWPPRGLLAALHGYEATHQFAVIIFLFVVPRMLNLMILERSAFTDIEAHSLFYVIIINLSLFSASYSPFLF